MKLLKFLLPLVLVTTCECPVLFADVSIPTLIPALSPADARLVDKLEAQFKSGELPATVVYMLENIFREASYHLRKKGGRELAAKIVGEWKTIYRPMLVGNIRNTDLGDHEPLSEWLDVVYFSIEIALGQDLCKFYHIDDILVINYSIPVVFNPRRDDIDSEEYVKHFVPLAGCVTYWGSYGACAYYTHGAAVLVCMPAAKAARLTMETIVAPPVGALLYDVCNSNAKCEDGH